MLPEMFRDLCSTIMMRATVDQFKDTFSLLSAEDVAEARSLLFLMIIVSVVDTLGVTSVMPFIMVLSDPSVMQSNEAFEIIHRYFDFASVNSYLSLIGLIVFLLILLSNLLKSVLLYRTNSFVMMQEARMSSRLLKTYLFQDYENVAAHNPTDLAKNILSEVSEVTNGALIPALTFISQGITCVFLVLVLTLINFEIAMYAFSFITISYLILYKSMSRLLRNTGHKRELENANRFKIVTESFSNLMINKIMSVEERIVSQFTAIAKRYASHRILARSISELPRYAFEAVAFGGMVALLLFLLSELGDLAKVLPVVGLYAFAGYRLIPSLQQLYGSITAMRYMNPTVKKLKNVIGKAESHLEKMKPSETLALTDNLELIDIKYSHKGAEKLTLSGINLFVQKNSIIGLSGPSGSGKTTTIEILTGLRKPSFGKIKLNGVVLDAEELRSMRGLVGYVPQHINFIEGSIIDNIAYGTTSVEADLGRVKEAAKLAQIHQFVEEDLPNGYETIVGEIGTKLSTGQRQRLAIARALYHKPEILIFDEASSALDSKNERLFLETCAFLKESCTIIFVSHQIEPLKICDTIYFVEGGLVKAVGDFTQIQKLIDR